MKTLSIFLLVITISLNSNADSDGAVAFGDSFVAYTSFSKVSSGQNLNIVQLNDEGKIINIAMTHLPISWSKLSTKENTIYLETYNKLYEYEFIPPNQIKLINILENKYITEQLDHSIRNTNKQGDWLIKNGDCENVNKPDKQYYLCLVNIEYSSQNKLGALIFHEKLLISRLTNKTVSSIQINSRIETIH